MKNKFEAKYNKPNSAWDDDCARAKELLELNAIYDVRDIDIHSYHTRIYLVGFDEWFNSTSFTFYFNGKPVPDEEMYRWRFCEEFGANTYDYPHHADMYDDADMSECDAFFESEVENESI
jgi:hypothetical protein